MKASALTIWFIISYLLQVCDKLTKQRPNNYATMTGFISEYNSRQEERKTTPRRRSDKMEKAVVDVEIDDVTQTNDVTQTEDYDGIKSDGVIQSEEMK